MTKSNSRARKNEVIGGGFFVFRRGKTTGRIGCRPTTMPFEHGSFESAATEAKRLTEANPGKSFSVFEEIQSYPILVQNLGDWCECNKIYVDRCACMGD